MYCCKCDERMFEDYITDEEGWEYSYDVQVCKSCNPKRKWTEDELRIYLEIAVEDWNYDS